MSPSTHNPGNTPNGERSDTGGLDSAIGDALQVTRSSALAPVARVNSPTDIQEQLSGIVERAGEAGIEISHSAVDVVLRGAFARDVRLVNLSRYLDSKLPQCEVTTTGLSQHDTAPEHDARSGVVAVKGQQGSEDSYLTFTISGAVGSAERTVQIDASVPPATPAGQQQGGATDIVPNTPAGLAQFMQDHGISG